MQREARERAEEQERLAKAEQRLRQQREAADLRNRRRRGVHGNFANAKTGGRGEMPGSLPGPRTTPTGRYIERYSTY